MKFQVVGHQPFIKLETVFEHRELNDLFTRFLDIQKNFERFTAVLFFRPLFALPAPMFFSHTPLKTLTTGRPLAIQAHMETVVFWSS